MKFIPDEEINTTFELLEKITNLTHQKNKELYNELVKHKDSEEYKEEIKKYCKKFKVTK